MTEYFHRQSHCLHGLPLERGGLIIPAWIIPVGAQDLDQHIVLESIPGPSYSDMISIETLADESNAPTNPPLTDPLGPELLQLIPQGSTPVYTYVPLSMIYPMEESETSLPYTSAISVTMSSLPPLIMTIPTPPSTPLTSS